MFKQPWCVIAFVGLLSVAGLFTAMSRADSTEPASPATTAPAPPLTAEGLIANSDNQHPPYLGVYRWDVGGLAKGEHDTFEKWLGRTNVWPLTFQSKSTWSDVEGPAWQLKPWGEWIARNPRARMVYGVVMLPGPWNRSGPERGPRAKIPVSLSEGAKGTYNAHYRKLAENLVAHGLGNSILRIGWEFNGGWMTWRVGNKQDAQNFAEFWRQIVTTMRAVPGTEKIEFCWNPNFGWELFPCDASWPGDEFVDYIGVDIYDDCYLKDVYPWPDDASEKDILARRRKAWDHQYNGQFGLKWFARFAADRRKPLSVPEWGVNLKKDKRGGLDNPHYIEQMHRFIHDPANNVAWHAFFDVQAPDGHHQLSPGASGAVTEFPRAAALFHQLFAVPPAATQP